MSIIYDALTKTQKNVNRGSKVYPQKSSRFNWFNTLISIAILTLLVIDVVYYPILKNNFHKITSIFSRSAKPNTPAIVTLPTPKPVPAPVPAVINQTPVEVAYQGNLQLSGVFISDSEKIAFINNATTHIGDTVEGKKIISIDSNKVKLQDGNHIYILLPKS